MRHQALNCFDVDQIHDLRVASRRLRGVLEQLGPFIGFQRADRLRGPVKRLTHELGQLRNLDEALLYLQKTGQQELEPLLESLEHQRDRESLKSRRLLESLDCMKIERQIRTASAALVSPDNIASQGLLALLSDRNLALYRPVHELLPLVAVPEMIEERHSLRIAIKKWRYFTELLHELLGRKQTELLNSMRQYQTLLGEMNDRVVFSVLISGEPGLPELRRKELLNGIRREQGRLLKKLRDLLDKQPLVYRFEL